MRCAQYLLRYLQSSIILPTVSTGKRDRDPNELATDVRWGRLHVGGENPTADSQILLQRANIPPSFQLRSIGLKTTEVLQCGPDADGAPVRAW